MKLGIVLLNIILISLSVSHAQAEAGDTQTFVIYGNGVSSQGGDIEWRGAQIGVNHEITDNTRVGVVYYNEGHPENNHRDGYAVMGWRKQDLTDNLSAEVGAGPYYSMNTTNKNGQQYNEKQLGALVAAAVLYRIYGTGVSLRAQYTRSVGSGSFSTDTLLVGVQANLGDARNSRDPRDGSYPTEFSMWAGPSHTTQSDAGIPTGYQIEGRKQVSEHIAYSASALSEGNSGMSNRKGIVGQVWYVSPTKNNWRVDVGAGPYLAHDNAEGRNENKVLAVVSFRVSKKISKKMQIGVSFNRVVSGNNRDQDMFMMGVQRNF